MYGRLEIGAVPGKGSMTNSTSVFSGILVTSLERHPEKSLTTRMLPPKNFSSTKNAASLMVVVTTISTSNLSPLELVSSTVPLA